MIKSIEKTARTEDEAVAAALEELGMAREQVSIEILERAKSGFLGIGSVPARVRVSYEYSVSKTEATEAFLTGLFERIGVEAVPKATENDAGGIDVVIEGESIGSLIGRRGETLDAIQHLTNYAVNRSGSRVRINIDAENYRAKRAEALERLANKVAGKVVKYRRNVTLEPMNAYERHVIHTALQEFDGVTTYSMGTEPNRRVVVAYTRGQSGGDREYSRESRRSGSRPPREAREPEPEKPAPVEEYVLPDAPSKYTSREWS